MARLALTGILSLLLMAAAPSTSFAHAVLLETSPADRAALAAPPEAITLRFNEPVRPISVRILHAEEQTEVEPSALAAIDTAVRVALPEPLADGTYVVSYRVISADTHPIGGAFMFTVGLVDGRIDPDLAAAPTTTPPGSWLRLWPERPATACFCSPPASGCSWR